MFNQKKYSQADAGYRRVARKIFAAMTLLPLVPFLSLLLLVLFYNSDTLEKDALWKLSRVAQDHGLMLDSYLSERVGDLQALASLQGIPALALPEHLKAAFESLKETNGVYVDLGVIDPSGTQVAYQGPFDLISKQYSEEAWYRETLAQGQLVSDVFLGFRGTPHFIVAVRGTGNSEGWVLRATLDNDMFNELVRSVDIGATSQAFLMDRSGLMQTMGGLSNELMETVPDHERFPALADGPQHFTLETEEGDLVHFLAPVNHGRWRLVVTQDHSEAFAPLRRFGWWVVAVMVLGGCLILAVGWFFSSRLYKQMMLALEESEGLKQQLIRAARLAEVGEMAAGIAHEINNPLQTMNSELTLMEMDLDDVEKSEKPLTEESSKALRESIDQLKHQIQRCAKITSSILKFGRYGAPESIRVQPTAIVPEVVGMVDKKAAVEGVKLNVDMPPKVPEVFCDPGQLEQVLVNLLNNALDTVVQRFAEGGGRIDLRMETDGATVNIVIRDNGMGISEEVKEKVFSPFFTTKPVGKGTGLGLSICYAILESMGGGIDLDTTVGQGTTFTVTLPAAK